MFVVRHGKMDSATAGLTYSFQLGMELGELLIQHRFEDARNLFLRWKSHVDVVELGEQSIRDDVAASARWSHRRDQL